MANAVYQLLKQSLLTEADTNNGFNVNTATDGVFCSLVDTGTYTFSQTHQFFSSLSGIVGTDQRITTPTVTNGTFDGDDLTYTAVSGASVEALVLYRHNSGANTTWRLGLYLDTGVTGLPVTPNGGNITITWNASGIFALSDEREKADIKQVDKIGPLPVYEYRYANDNERMCGFIAQDVEQVVPAAVLEFRGRKHVNYEMALALAA